MKDLSKEAQKAYRLSPCTSLYDFTHSETADLHGFSNLPTDDLVPACRLTCQKLLQPIADHFGKSIKIVSGYRSLRLNTMLNGALHSQHLFGQAVDFKVVGISYRTVVKWIAENLDYDILLLEYDDYNYVAESIPWIHLSYVANANRKLDLTTEAGMRAYHLAPNFTLWEMVRSATATARKIYNIPDEAGIEKLSLVCNKILQPVRDHFKQPVRVNSGYRSPQLNAATRKASKTSQHMRCEAADYEIMGIDNFELAQWVAQNLEYDQLILEFYGNDTSDPNDGWVHTSYKSSRNRRQNLTINEKGTYVGLKSR